MSGDHRVIVERKRGVPTVWQACCAPCGFRGTETTSPDLARRERIEHLEGRSLAAPNENVSDPEAS